MTCANTVETPAAEQSDRRSQDRYTMILRVGLLEQNGEQSFCLIRNVSSDGIQIKLYTSAARPGYALVRIADEDPLPGRIVWIKNGNAGIRFDQDVDPAALLRLQQKLIERRRRSMPRMKASASAALRVNGRKLKAELQDISSMGARVTTSRALENGSLAFIQFPDMPEIKAYVRWTDQMDAGLAFEPPIPMQVIGQWIDERSRVIA